MNFFRFINIMGFKKMILVARFEYQPYSDITSYLAKRLYQNFYNNSYSRN